MARELLAETVTRKDAGASPMDGFTACLSKKLPIHVPDHIVTRQSLSNSQLATICHPVNGTAVILFIYALRFSKATIKKDNLQYSLHQFVMAKEIFPHTPDKHH